MSTTQMLRMPSGRMEYRLAGAGTGAILAFHGAHLSAAGDVGIGDLAAQGRRVLVVSRPGYGRAPVEMPRAHYVDRVARLAQDLGITQFDTVVGMSAGGAAALSFAGRYPQLTRSLILQSALSSEPHGVRSMIPALWAYNPATQWLTWHNLRMLLRFYSDDTVERVLGSLSTVSGREVIADLTPGEKPEIVNMLRHMGSGSGFLMDVLEPVRAEEELAVRAPSLIIASPYDGQVPVAHSRYLATVLPDARLHLSSSRSHLVWFGSGVPAMRAAISQLLSSL